MTEQPLKWRVHAIDGHLDYIEVSKPPPIREEYDDPVTARKRADDLKRAGMIATVTPVYMGGMRRYNARRKAQTNPFGNFCEQWKLHQ